MKCIGCPTSIFFFSPDVDIWTAAGQSQRDTELEALYNVAGMDVLIIDNKLKYAENNCPFECHESDLRDSLLMWNCPQLGH